MLEMRRRALVLTFASCGCIPFAGGGAPLTARVPTTSSIPEAHQCAVRVLDGFGYVMMETRTADGVVRARRGEDAVDVTVFEDSDGRAIRIVAARVDKGNWKAPRNPTRADVSTIVQVCAAQ